MIITPALGGLVAQHAPLWLTSLPLPVKSCVICKSALPHLMPCLQRVPVLLSCTRRRLRDAAEPRVMSCTV